MFATTTITRTTSSLDTDVLLGLIHRNGKVVKKLPVAEDGFSGIRIREEDTAIAVLVSVGIAGVLVCAAVLVSKWRRGHFSHISNVVPSFILGLCPVCCRSGGAAVVATATLFFHSLVSHRANSKSSRPSPDDADAMEHGHGDQAKAACEKQLQDTTSILPTLLIPTGQVADQHSPKATLEDILEEEHPQTRSRFKVSAVRQNEPKGDNGIAEEMVLTVEAEKEAEKEVTLATGAAEDPVWQAPVAEVIDLDLPPYTCQDVQPVRAEGHVWTPPALGMAMRPVGALQPASALIVSQKRPDDVVDATDEEGFFYL